LEELKNQIENIFRQTSGESTEDDVDEQIHLNREARFARIHPLVLDLTSLHSVREFVHNFRQLSLPLHFLINNAGILSETEISKTQLTDDGFNTVLQTNYLAHFYLTALLLPILLSTAISLLPTSSSSIATESSSGTTIRTTTTQPSICVRIVNVTSMAHHLSSFSLREFKETMRSPPIGVWTTYGDSKLLQILHASHLCSLLSVRHPYLPLITASVAPGIVYSPIGQSTCFTRAFCCIARPCLRTPVEGARPILWTLLDKTDVRINTSGEYWESCHKGDRSSRSDNPLLAEEIWQSTLQMLREWEQKEGVKNTMQV
jgi:WW domain-containing oxidoreductase